MSKYGYTGGAKRPVDSSMKQDPEGPSIDELNRFFKASVLKDRDLAARIDPRAGGPAFRKQVNIPKRTWIARNPRLFSMTFAGSVLFLMFVVPGIISGQTPKSAEDAEYETALKRAWNEKSKDIWYVPKWR